MEEDQEMRELVERLEAQLARQGRWTRLHCVLTGACCALLLVLALALAPRVLGLAERMDAVMADLESITAELAEADLKGMVEDVDALAVSSQAAVDAALAKLEAIDFETLDRAIGDLADVVEPLAKFFNIFH